MSGQIFGVIPAVNDFPQLRAFLKSDYPRCVLMHWKLGDLDKVFPAISAAGKTALVHSDLIGGLDPSPDGIEFLVRRFAPEGIISIKAPAVKAAKELGVTAVQRVFLIDSAALAKSEAAVSRAGADYVEFLPAPCPSLYPRLAAAFNVPLIAGGLISSAEEAQSILSHDEIKAVTVSMATLKP